MFSTFNNDDLICMNYNRLKYIKLLNVESFSEYTCFQQQYYYNSHSADGICYFFLKIKIKDFLIISLYVMLDMQSTPV